MNISIKNTEPPSLNTMKNEVISIKYNKKDDFYPDNYYKYNLNGVLNSDFSQLKTASNTFIYACCFRVIESKPNKIIQNPFLEYLLFKYPNSNSSHSNLCIFPFRILGKDTVKQASKKLLNDLKYKTTDCLGFIQNRKGIFLFYEIPYKKYNVNLYKKNTQLWWTTIHEICNSKCILNFPIHNSVTQLFLNNNKYDSDTLFSDVCGSFKLKVTDNAGNLLEERYFNIGVEGMSILMGTLFFLSQRCIG